MGVYAGPANAWSNFRDSNRIDASTKLVVQSGLVLNLDAGASTSYVGSGTTWTDLSGNGNNATLTNGPTYSSANGGSIVFDGVNDYVAPTGLTNALWQGNWTVSFWVNFDIINSGNYPTDRILLQHGVVGTRTAISISVRFSRLHHALFTDDMGGTATLTAGTWYNCAFTLNNTTYARNTYLNGSLDTSGTAGGAYVGTASNTIIAGVSLNFGLTFDGFMSACSVYNRVLTASEIQQNFNALRGRFGI